MIKNCPFSVWKFDDEAQIFTGARAYQGVHAPGVDVYAEIVTGLNLPNPLLTQALLQAATGFARPVLRQIAVSFSFFGSLPSASAPPSYVAGSYPEESVIFQEYAASRLFLQPQAPPVVYSIPVLGLGAPVEIPPLDFGNPASELYLTDAGLPLAPTWDPVDPITITANLQLFALITEG